MAKILNMSAACPAIEKNIKEICLNTYSSFRSECFDDKISYIKKKLADILNLNINLYDIAIINSSGTGGMESAVTSFINEAAKCLIVSGGRFGHLWRDICLIHKLDVIMFDVSPTKDIDYDALEKFISYIKPEFLLCQHNETSTMTLYDIKKIGYLCQQYRVKFVVDACSSFMIDIIDMNYSNIDILIAGSQKGLMIFPGIAIVIAKKELEVNSRLFYLDFHKYKKIDTNIIQPFTPPVYLIEQFIKRLKTIDDMGGIPQWIKKFENQANNFRELCHINGLCVVSNSHSNCGTIIKIDGNKHQLILKYLQKNNIYITHSVGFWGNFLSIGHIGDLTTEDNLRLIKEIKKCLV